MSSKYEIHPESQAETRYSEIDSVEVLLLADYCLDDNRSGVWITLLNGKKFYLPKNGKAQKKQHWRFLAATLMRNTVRVADYLAPVALPQKSLEYFKDYLYLGSKEHSESVLRVAKVKTSGELISLNFGTISTDYQLSYDHILGYQAKKI